MIENGFLFGMRYLIQTKNRKFFGFFRELKPPQGLLSDPNDVTFVFQVDPTGELVELRHSEINHFERNDSTPASKLAPDEKKEKKGKKRR